MIVILTKTDTVQLTTNKLLQFFLNLDVEYITIKNHILKEQNYITCGKNDERQIIVMKIY